MNSNLKFYPMKRFVIINALIWAFLIIAITFFAKDLPNYKYIFAILVFASALQISLLNSLGAKSKQRHC